jgi:FkbM family methyltransferase
MIFKSYLRRKLRLAFARGYEAVLNRYPRALLSEAASAVERSLARSYDQSRRLDRLLQAPLEYLDIGARSGIPRLFAHYRDYVRSTLVEPEPIEAARLRDLGYTVIEKALGDHAGRTELKVTSQPGASSVLQPNGAFDSYWTTPREASATSGFEAKRRVVRSIDVEVTTVSQLANERGHPFDVIKVDVQGAEYDVLSAIEGALPLYLMTEVSLVESYSSQKTFYDVAKLLFDHGYMMLSFDVPHQRPDGYRMPRVTLRGLPLHGDVVFLADWSRPAGLELIRRRDNQFAALSLILGVEDLLLYILDTADLPHAERIREALRAPVDGRFDPNGLSASPN